MDGFRNYRLLAACDGRLPARGVVLNLVRLRKGLKASTSQKVTLVTPRRYNELVVHADIVSSNPDAVYWMDVSNITKKINKIKIAQSSTHKKNIYKIILVISNSYTSEQYLQSSWVFEHENEEIFNDYDEIQEQDCLQLKKSEILFFNSIV